MIFKILKISSLILGVAIIVINLFLFFNIYSTQADSIKYDLSGWFWSDNYGWISLNSKNSALTDYYTTSTYKVVLDSTSTNLVTGWGWSTNVGWVCFGSTCDGSGVIGARPSGGWQASFNGNNLVGWAKVISLGDNGWINLGERTLELFAGQAGVDCYGCKYTTSTLSELTGCDVCFTSTKVNRVNIPDKEVSTAVGGSGSLCSNCTGCAKVDTFRTECGSCVSCRNFGGFKDDQTGGLVGWGWGGNNSVASTTGAGWVQYNPQGGESGVVYPWVQTLYGPVFSAGSIRQKSIAQKNNATYCIFAKEVYNFKSSSCDSSKISGINIAFPQNASSSDNAYQNVLGRLDLDGLTSIDRQAGNINYNKYGNVIESNWSSLPGSLDNKVYVKNGDLTINATYLVKNGTGNLKGNGIVVVNGNLIINKDIIYEVSNNLTDLKKLASIAWVVKGDVIIAPAVQNISGAFLVFGNSSSTCKFDNGLACTSQDYPKYSQNGYGVFFSGASNINNDNPLTVYGLLMAKAFDFRRMFTSIDQGSERVIYDGRLIANPPPGLKSLMEGLPLIRDFNF